MYDIEQKIIQKLQLLMLSAGFKNDIKSIKEKFNPPLADDEAVKGFIEIYFYAPDIFKGFIFDDVKSLCSKYKLSDLYFLYLFIYIISDKIPTNLAPAVLIEQSKIDNPESVSIKMYKEVAIDDCNKIFAEAKKILNGGKKDNKRFKKIENLDRDTKVYLLYKEGKDAPEIAKEINKEFTNKKDPNIVLGYEEIPKIISRFRKRVIDLLP